MIAVLLVVYKNQVLSLLIFRDLRTNKITIKMDSTNNNEPDRDPESGIETMVKHKLKNSSKVWMFRRHSVPYFLQLWFNKASVI
jgi:hypothetical protein